MAKSSFNSSSSSSHSDAHNERLDEPNYILDYNAKNEFIRYFDKEEYLETCIQNTKNITGRKMQSKAIDNFYQESIINTLPHHQISDIEKLFNNLQTNFKTKAFKVQSIAIHKDEGVFIKSDLKVDDLYYDHNSKTWFDKEKNDVTSEVQVFRPGRTVFYNKENSKWYDNRKFENEVDTSTFQMYHNYHAHAVYTRYDFEKGKNIRLNKNDMSKIQDVTADTLGMERGKHKAKIKNLEEFYTKVVNEMPQTTTLEEYKKAFIYTSKKITNRDYQRSSNHKHHNHLKDEAEKPKYDFKDMQKQITSLEELTTEQKRELHKLNSQVKNDKATIEELHLKVKTLQTTAKIDENEVLTLRTEKEELINELQGTKNIKEELDLAQNAKNEAEGKFDSLTTEVNEEIKPILEVEGVEPKKYGIMSIQTNSELNTENKALREENTDLKVKIIGLESDIELAKDEEVRTLDDIASDLDADEEYKLCEVPDISTRKLR